MKAEERKALMTNDLAKGIEEAYKDITHPPKTALYWTLGIVAVVIAVLVFRYLMWTAESAASERWVALDEAVFPEQIALVDEKGTLKDTPQGRMLEFKEARMMLADGLRQLGLNPRGATTRLREAVEKYEQLLKNAGRVPLLHQEALWGAAKGNEALGDVTKAKEWYTKLANEYKSTALGADAEKQLKRLESSPELRELAKEFAVEAPGRPN
jgi:hypothetical protein